LTRLDSLVVGLDDTENVPFKPVRRAEKLLQHPWRRLKGKSVPEISGFYGMHLPSAGCGAVVRLEFRSMALP
jgi:hypothetical protein